MFKERKKKKKARRFFLSEIHPTDSTVSG